MSSSRRQVCDDSRRHQAPVASLAVLVAVIVLAVTNVATLAALAWVLMRRPAEPGPDDAIVRALRQAPGPSSSAVRRVITVEIVNWVELAGTRGRAAAIAGSVLPGLVKRMVYDETVKIMRRMLVAEGVVADVRLHDVVPADRRSTT